jgi:hypothetical protein
LPVVGWRVLGEEDKIGTTADTSHECKPTAVTAHDLDNEGTLVREGGSVDEVDSLANTL